MYRHGSWIATLATATVFFLSFGDTADLTAGKAPSPSASEAISFTSRPKPSASSPSAPSAPSPAAARASTASATASASASRSSSVGALRVTPSGAARGGADHMTAADSSGRSSAAQLSLAIGTTAAASAGTILVVRRLQRRVAGEHH